MNPQKPTQERDLSLSCSIWGARAGRGDWHEITSPIDGSLIGRTRFLSPAELAKLCTPQAPLNPISSDDLRSFSARLYVALSTRASEFENLLRRETGFIRADCHELVDGTLAYAREFPDSLHSAFSPTIKYENDQQKRRIRFAHAPWGTVAVILPQNAFLIVAVTCLLNALAAGNRVILRAPSQSGASAALLVEALLEARPPHDAASLVLCRATDFSHGLQQSKTPLLMHYMGSSRHATSILRDSFASGQSAIIDGEGHVWVWVGEDADLKSTAKLLTAGALRYNGQTCTSINGALIHPAVYEPLRELLLKRWGKLKSGNPMKADTQVGPLMDATQAQWCFERIQISGGEILCGGKVEGHYLTPTLVEKPAWNSELVTQGLFGSALWIQSATAEEFVEHWPSNQFPLGAAILSPSAEPDWWLVRLPNLARLSLNGDPSVEYIFEPWGGYPGSGTNAVSVWVDKYRRTVAVDEAVN